MELTHGMKQVIIRKEITEKILLYLAIGTLLTAFSLFVKADLYIYFIMWFCVIIACHTTVAFIQDIKNDRITVYKAEAVDNFIGWRGRHKEFQITLKLG